MSSTAEGSNVLPTLTNKLVVKKITANFREAVEIVCVPIPTPGPGEVLVKNLFLGINASEINFTAGRYFTSKAPPFDCGFEAIGEVVSLGSDCNHSTIGQAVAFFQFGAFSEYCIVPEATIIPLSSANAHYLPLLVSGLTAAISLEKVGQIESKDVVLVTAAAGGTGQFAVQLAKSIGCHVIGVCSSAEKVEFLRSIGCDRPIDYKTEDLGAVLKKEYPTGVDVVYECIGGEIFQTCLDNLAIKGRIIIIGFISGYQDEKEHIEGPPLEIQTSALLGRLLRNSQSLRGFIVSNYALDWSAYIPRLIKLYDEGKIFSAVDTGRFSSSGGPFRGIESIADAVEYLYSRKSIGKIVVQLGTAS